MESITPTSSAKEGNKTSRRKPFNRRSESSSPANSDTKPLSTEDASYVNFPFRAPSKTENKRDKTSNDSRGVEIIQEVPVTKSESTEPKKLAREFVITSAHQKGSLTEGSDTYGQMKTTTTYTGGESGTKEGVKVKKTEFLNNKTEDRIRETKYSESGRKVTRYEDRVEVVYGDGKITDPNKISKEIYERGGKKTIIYGDGRTETILKKETLEPKGSPLTNSEETNYVNFGYRAPAEKKKEEAPITQNVQNPMNQLNTDGSNREEFNYAAFAYQDPKAKETPTENIPVTETTPIPTIPKAIEKPKPVAPVIETPEDTRGVEITQETPEAKIEDLNFDIAIGQLTEQEKKEIIRERQRTAEDTAQEAVMTGKWYQKVWGSIKFSFNKNYEKFRMLDTLKGLPADEVFANDRNEFRKRSDQRADELAALMAENEFTKISKNKGFEEGYTDLLASDENKQKSKELISLIKEFSKDPTKNRDDFEQRKKVILEEMIKNAPELKGSISDNFDNVWTKVEYIRDRASALKLSADKIDSMNISMNIRFGKARFESKTKDNETLSSRVEDAISSSKWLSSIPVERRYWAMALVVTSSSKINSAIQKITTLTGYGSLGATMAISGAVSGTFEYIRKKDQLTETASRLTRRLAAGGNSGEFLDKYGAADMESLIKLEKIEPLLNGIKNLNNLYETATTPQDKEAALTGLLQQISKFQALYELEEKTGDRFQASSATELNKYKTETIKTATQILSGLNSIDPTIKDKYTSAFNAEKSKIEKQIELDKKILTAANKSKAIKSAAKVAVVSAILSGVFSSETFKKGAALVTNKAMSAFGITPEWGKSHGLGGFLPQTEKKYEIVKEFQDVTSNVSGQERLSKLMENSNVVDDIVRKYNGTAEGQIAAFGGLTRSMWSKTPGEEAVLDIFGRTMKDGSTLLHDFDKGYLDAFNQGKFQVLVTLADGHKVLASPADLIMGADGTLKVDFSKDSGILGEIFKDGHESGLAHIKHIQYGIGDPSNMEVVSTIKGGGEAFIPDPTEVTQRIVKQTLKISEDIKIDDTPVFFPIFRSPKSGRTPRTTTETTPVAPVAPASRVERTAPAPTTPASTTTPAAPVSRVERTAPAPSGTVEESFSTKIDKDKLKLEIEKGELDDYSLIKPFFILKNSIIQIKGASNETGFKVALKKLRNHISTLQSGIQGTELEKLLLDLESNLFDKYDPSTIQFSKKEEILGELAGLLDKYLAEVASLHLGELAKSVKNENLTVEMSDLSSEIQDAINSYQISKDKKDLNKLKAKLGSIKSSNPEILKLINSIESAIKISEESKPQPENVLNQLKHNRNILRVVTLLNRSATATPETPAAPVSELGRTAAVPSRLVFGPAEPTKPSTVSTPTAATTTSPAVLPGTPASTTTPVAPVSELGRTAAAPSRLVFGPAEPTKPSTVSTPTAATTTSPAVLPGTPASTTTPVAPVSELGRTAAVPSRLVFGPAEPTKVDTKAEASEPEKSETDSNKNLIEKLELLKSMISKMIEKLSKNPEKLEELLKEFEADIAPLNQEMSKTAYYVNYKQLLDTVRDKLTIKIGSDSLLNQLSLFEKVLVSDIEKLK